MFGLREVIGQGRGIKLWRNQCAKAETPSAARFETTNEGSEVVTGGFGHPTNLSKPHFLLFYPKMGQSQHQ